MTARLDRLLRDGPVGVRGRHRAGLVCGILLIAMVFACPVLAAERELDEDPAPGSAGEIKTPGQRVFPEVEERPPLFPWLGKKLETLPPFLADTVLRAYYRTYYLAPRSNERDTQ